MLCRVFATKCAGWLVRVRVVGAGAVVVNSVWWRRLSVGGLTGDGDEERVVIFSSSIFGSLPLGESRAWVGVGRGTCLTWVGWTWRNASSGA